MLFVVCLLFVLLFVVCCSLFVVCWLLAVICDASLIVRCVLLVV